MLRTFVVTLGLAATCLQGTPILGTLNITGNASVTVGGAVFKCDLGTTCAPGHGAFFATGGSANTGDFQALAVSFGEILSLSTTTTPLNQDFFLPKFLTFNGNPDIEVELRFFYLGNGGTCPPTGSQTCTPTFPDLVSPSDPLGLAATNWQNTPIGSTASLSVLADFIRVSTGERTPYRGIFTAQFGQPAQNVIAALGAGGSVSTSYSATFVPTPEPAPWISAGLGLLFLGLVRRQRSA